MKRDEDASQWPSLPLKDWQDTYHTLHLWTQVVGKIRLMLSPRINHWWNVSLYVNARGLTTSAVPYGLDAFEIEFNFMDHRLNVRASDGGRTSFPLRAEPVASFYDRVMAAVRSLGMDVAINTKPQEMAETIPFEQNRKDAAYDPDAAHRFWRVLLSSAMALGEFRSRFIGKCSPVQFFWGSFDLACSRFSGRLAPPRKGLISSEAYSHEVISAGFWPGGGAVDGAAFYSYTVPKPEGLENAPVEPGFWSRDLSEFILMYDEARAARSPRAILLDFFQKTYAAGANLAGWDRSALERRDESGGV